MAFFRKAKSDSSAFKRVFIALIIICILTGIVCISFYKKVQDTVLDESEHYLSEISRRTTSNVKRIIDDNFSVLHTLRSVIETNSTNNFTEISMFLKEQVTYWDFTNIMLIDDGGIAYDLDGKKISITGDSFLRTLSVEKNIVAPTQIINNEEKTVFSTPLNKMMVDGKQMVAVATIYNSEQFDKILSMDSFDEKASSYVVDSDGKMVIGSNKHEKGVFGYNVLHTIEKQDSNAKEKVEQLQKNIQNNKEGQFVFSLFNEQEYLMYTPIGIEDWYLFTFVPVSLVNANSTLLWQSASVVIGVIFLVFFIFLIVITTSFKRNKKRLEQIVYIDELTGGQTLTGFNESVSNLLQESQNQYALIYLNIQKFKLLNDQLGRVVCDRILQCIHQGIHSTLQENEYIAHCVADNFVILKKFKAKQELEDTFLQYLEEGKKQGEKNLDVLPNLTIEYGVYIIEDNKMEVDDLIDCSKLALRNGTNVHPKEDHIRFAYYNDEVRKKLVFEKELEDRMEYALTHQGFQVYLQPKYKTGTQSIVGAEALVRWIDEQGKMIYPSDFISLFEKNGFIIKLDLWMFEQVCKLQQDWKQKGMKMIPISINCSRVHLKNHDFLSSYEEIFKKYDFDANMLELEFTENMVFEDTQFLLDVIENIHRIGFMCSMDDFGSGYSTLNLLQDIHVDTLKLDRIFFKHDFASNERAKAIISCILEMAQSLRMKTVAEGVEDWKHVEILRKLGCDFIQGYVYAKPMPLKAFYKLARAQENK